MTREEWEVIKNHDPDYDGKFYVALTNTKTVCRPSCRARTFNPRNIVIFYSLEDAVTAGYRPCQRCCPEKEAWEGTRMEHVKNARKWIEEHYLEKFSLDVLAGAMHIDKNYLLRVFKEETNMTLLQYHNQVRCTRANELLQRPDLSVSFIAESVGYKTASHFVQVYKRTFGYTPSRYRETYFDSFL